MPTRYAIDAMRQTLFYPDLKGVASDLVALAAFAGVTLDLQRCSLFAGAFVDETASRSPLLRFWPSPRWRGVTVATAITGASGAPARSVLVNRIAAAPVAVSPPSCSLPSRGTASALRVSGVCDGVITGSVHVRRPREPARPLDRQTASGDRARPST